MKGKKDFHYSLKGLVKYISTIISWTIFVLLIIVGILLIYYYISLELYSTYGEKYEPRFSVYTIVSPSMEPTIKVYDVIINTKVKDIDDVKVNDVITFISTWEVTKGMTITHRVIGFKTLDNGEKCIITRGDNNTNDDQTCVKKGDIIGVTKGVIPGLGRIQFFLTSSGGWLLIIIGLGIYLIIKNIFRIMKMLDKNVENNEDNNKETNDKSSELDYKDNTVSMENEVYDERVLQKKYVYLKEIIKRRNTNNNNNNQYNEQYKG